MRNVREKRAVCTACTNAVSREVDVATQFPEECVPQYVQGCQQLVQVLVKTRLIDGTRWQRTQCRQGEPAGTYSEPFAYDDDLYTRNHGGEPVTYVTHDNSTKHSVTLDTFHKSTCVLFVECVACIPRAC